MMETFRRAHDHKGAAFVEIYQNCNVFNDGAFEAITGKAAPRRHADPARARRADPLRRRRRAGRGRSTPRAAPRIVDVAEVGRGRHPRARRDPRRPGLAFTAARRLAARPVRADADRRVPGRRAARVRRRGQPPARRRRGAQGPGDLAALLHSGATWTVDWSSADGCGLERRSPRLSSGAEDRRRCGAWGGRRWSSAACARRRGRCPRSGRRWPGGSSTPACGLARRDRAPDVVDAVLVGAARASGSAARRLVEAARCRGRRASSIASGRGAGAAVPVGEHQGERAGVDHGRATGRSTGGGLDQLEPRLEGGTQVDAVGRPASRRWIGRTVSSSLDQLDDVGQRGVRRAGVAVGGRRSSR